MELEFSVVLGADDIEDVFGLAPRSSGEGATEETFGLAPPGAAFEEKDGVCGSSCGCERAFGLAPPGALEGNDAVLESSAGGGKGTGAAFGLAPCG